MERLPLPFAALDSWGNFLEAHCADSLTDEGGTLKFLECLLSCRGRYSPIPVWRPQVQHIAPALASPPPPNSPASPEGMECQGTCPSEHRNENGGYSRNCQAKAQLDMGPLWTVSSAVGGAGVCELSSSSWDFPVLDRSMVSLFR